MGNIKESWGSKGDQGRTEGNITGIKGIRQESVYIKRTEKRIKRNERESRNRKERRLKGIGIC